MFISKKNFKKLIRDNEQFGKDIASLEHQVFGDDSISDIINNINKHTWKLKALMLHLNLDFEKSPEFRIIEMPLVDRN